MKSPALRQLLGAPATLRATMLPRALTPIHHICQTQRAYSTPGVTSASFWAGMIPKPFRKQSNPYQTKKPKSKEWNPATFFIFIFLLIGSNSIQMIALKNSFAAFTRRADAKIGLLKEVIERVQKGEDVDVEGLLGTGDKKREAEWEEVLREIEEEDQVWESSRRSKPKHGKNLESAAQAVEDKANESVKEIEKPTKSKKPEIDTDGFY